MFFFVMAGHSRPKDGVASLAYVPAIHVLSFDIKGVDARHKAGHDAEMITSFLMSRNECLAMSKTGIRPRNRTALRPAIL
jgi:hypothetical protein